MTKKRIRSEGHDFEAEPRHQLQGLFRLLPTPSFVLMCLLLPASFGTPPNSMAQEEPSQEQWGEKFNTASAKLALKEIERRHINGRTVVTYNLFASGLPHDASYVLWTRLVGRAPQPAAEAFLNGDGKVVSHLAVPERHIEEDPVNLKVFAGKGEPKQFALISKDGRFRVFAEVIPFPMEVFDGPCNLFAVMASENYFTVSIHVTGLQPYEDLKLVSQSDGEQMQNSAKASGLGTYDSALFPAVKGKRSGRARFGVSAKSCSVAIELPWGEGSYELQ